jgi:hypothetical protein
MGHIGIFGRTECGKTTLAKALSHAYWTVEQIPSIVLDINGEDWGPGATVFHDMETFLDCIDNSEGCAVFCDEGGDTINRNADLTTLFTRIRHKGHRFHVMGHAGTQLLPTQRAQLTTVYLFHQAEDDAKLWIRQYGDKRIEECMRLGEYEFLHCRINGATKGQPPERKKLEM